MLLKNTLTLYHSLLSDWFDEDEAERFVDTPGVVGVVLTMAFSAHRQQNNRYADPTTTARERHAFDDKSNTHSRAAQMGGSPPPSLSVSWPSSPVASARVACSTPIQQMQMGCLYSGDFICEADSGGLLTNMESEEEGGMRRVVTVSEGAWTVFGSSIRCTALRILVQLSLLASKELVRPLHAAGLLELAAQHLLYPADDARVYQLCLDFLNASHRIYLRQYYMHTALFATVLVAVLRRGLEAREATSHDLVTSDSSPLDTVVGGHLVQPLDGSGANSGSSLTAASTFPLTDGSESRLFWTVHLTAINSGAHFSTTLFPNTDDLLHASLRCLDRIYRDCDADAVRVVLRTHLVPTAVSLLMNHRLMRVKASQMILRFFVNVMKASPAEDVASVLEADGLLAALVSCLSLQADNDTNKEIIKHALHTLTSVPLQASSPSPQPQHYHVGYSSQLLESESAAAAAVSRDTDSSALRLIQDSGVLYLTLLWLSGTAEVGAPAYAADDSQDEQQQHHQRHSPLSCVMTPIQKESAELLYTLSSRSLNYQISSDYSNSNTSDVYNKSSNGYFAANLKMITNFMRQHMVGRKGPDIQRVELRSLTLVLQSLGHILESELSWRTPLDPNTNTTNNNNNGNASSRVPSSASCPFSLCARNVLRTQALYLLAQLSTNCSLAAHTELPRIAQKILQSTLSNANLTERERVYCILVGNDMSVLNALTALFSSSSSWGSAGHRVPGMTSFALETEPREVRVARLEVKRQVIRMLRRVLVTIHVRHANPNTTHSSSTNPMAEDTVFPSLLDLDDGSPQHSSAASRQASQRLGMAMFHNKTTAEVILESALLDHVMRDLSTQGAVDTKQPALLRLVKEELLLLHEVVTSPLLCDLIFHQQRFRELSVGSIMINIINKGSSCVTGCRAASPGEASSIFPPSGNNNTNNTNNNSNVNHHHHASPPRAAALRNAHDTSSLNLSPDGRVIPTVVRPGHTRQQQRANPSSSAPLERSAAVERPSVSVRQPQASGSAGGSEGGTNTTTNNKNNNNNNNNNNNHNNTESVYEVEALSQQVFEIALCTLWGLLSKPWAPSVFYESSNHIISTSAAAAAAASASAGRDGRSGGTRSAEQHRLDHDNGASARHGASLGAPSPPPRSRSPFTTESPRRRVDDAAAVGNSAAHAHLSMPGIVWVETSYSEGDRQHAPTPAASAQRTRRVAAAAAAATAGHHHRSPLEAVTAQTQHNRDALQGLSMKVLESYLMLVAREEARRDGTTPPPTLSSSRSGSGMQALLSPIDEELSNSREASGLPGSVRAAASLLKELKKASEAS